MVDWPDEDMFKRLIAVYLPPEFHRMTREEIARFYPADSITLAEKTGKLKRIDEILQNHAPCDPKICDAHALLVLLANSNAEALYERWDANEQVQNVDRAKRSLDNALKALRVLPPQIKRRLASDAEEQWLAGLAQRMGAGLALAKRLARMGEPVGQRDWQALSVARAARLLWESRTGHQAPFTIDAAAPGPFGRFLEELYAELEIPRSARSGLRSLNRISDQLG